MGQENFHASVQYDDFKGTAAADDHDMNSMSSYLKKLGLIKTGEVLVGVEMWSGEVHAENQDDNINVTAIVSEAAGYDNVVAAVNSGKPLSVRKIDLDMPLNEFFGMFKRFNICISNNGVIDNRDITFDD